MVMGGAGLTAHGAVADLLPADKPDIAPALEPKAQREADALSWFVTGLFAEESEGPEKAMESYRKALELDPANTDLAVRIAYDHLRRGETAEAIALLKDSVKAAPKKAEPCLALSAIYFRHLHKPDLAAKYAQMALDIDTKSFAPYGALFDLYQLQGQNAKAEQVLEKAERSKSEDPAFWLSLSELAGRKLLREGGAGLAPDELQRLSRLLDKASESSSKSAETLSRVGDIYVLARQLDKALPLYKKVVDIKPSLPNAREKLAGVYLETGQSEAAIAVLEDLVKSNPLNIAAYDQLMQLYLRSENVEKALANAEQALILAPGDPNRYDQIVRLALDLKRFDTALTHTREAIRRFPRTPVFSFFEALALSETKRHDEAIKAFERTVIEAGNSHPDLLDGDFYFSYGAAAEQAKQYVKAAELFQKSIALDPASSARSYNYLGYMWVERNENLDEAAQLIKRALDMEPNNGAYIDSLGWLYFKQGKYQEALTELLRAAELLPEPDAVVFEHVADAYDKLGKKTEAVLYWQKALQLDPENKLLAEKLDKAAEKVAQQPKSTKAPITEQTPAP